VRSALGDQRIHQDSIAAACQRLAQPRQVGSLQDQQDLELGPATACFLHQFQSVAVFQLLVGDQDLGGVLVAEVQRFADSRDRPHHRPRFLAAGWALSPVAHHMGALGLYGCHRLEVAAGGKNEGQLSQQGIKDALVVADLVKNFEGVHSLLARLGWAAVSHRSLWQQAWPASR